ncbi:MAG: thioredoxin family protein [Candidatus Levybacteria bacterium]|nr:thioredoxin family protein [Candidatus Levybacteria bacterium]
MWTDGSFMEAGEMMEDDSAMGSNDSAIATRYVDYSSNSLSKATANNGCAVLFFAALAWCPSCQAADRNFKANFDEVPGDVTILKVDYDNDSAMKKKYAITMQDTFIQVDSQGKEITRWNSGGKGVEALLTNLN